MKRIFILISIMLSFLAYGEGHENVATTDGAFTTLMISAPDIDKYVDDITFEKPRAEYYIDDKAILYDNNWKDILEDVL